MKSKKQGFVLDVRRFMIWHLTPFGHNLNAEQIERYLQGKQLLPALQK